MHSILRSSVRLRLIYAKIIGYPTVIVCRYGWEVDSATADIVFI
jgi:hypothetical protein